MNADADEVEGETSAELPDQELGHEKAIEIPEADVGENADAATRPEETQSTEAGTAAEEPGADASATEPDESNAGADPSIPVAEKTTADVDATIDRDAEDIIEDDDDYVKQIPQAAEWARGVLQATVDSLWYERLGETYRNAFGWDAAVQAYNQAISMDGSNWKAFEGLALAHGGKPDVAAAATEMRKSLAMQRDIKDPDDDDRKSLLENILLLADWQVELAELESAFQLYHEAVTMDPDDYTIHYRRLKHLLAAGNDTRALELVGELANNKTTEGNLSQIRAVFEPLLQDDDHEVVFGQLFSATGADPVFKILLDEMTAAIRLAREDRSYADLAKLLLFKGTAVFHYDQAKIANSESPMSLWHEAGSMQPKSGQAIEASQLAVRFMSMCHFDQARSSLNPSSHVEKLEQIVNKQEYEVSIEDARSYLASYYALTGQTSKGREAVVSDLQSGLDMLTDDTDTNDWQGYYTLANALMHVQDNRRALTAWAYIGKTKIGVAQGPYTCDGRCGTTWPWAGDFHCCAYCVDLEFCLGCLNKLKEGKLKRFICSPSHRWLYVPILPDAEYEEIQTKKIVTVGGELVDGVRQGGEEMSEEDYFNGIRDDWGVARPPASKDERKSLNEIQSPVQTESGTDPSISGPLLNTNVQVPQKARLVNGAQPGE